MDYMVIGGGGNGCPYRDTDTHTHTTNHGMRYQQLRKILGKISKLTLCHDVTTHPYTNAYTHAHTYIQMHTHTQPPIAPDRGFCKAWIIPANPHSLRMNCMIACHHQQPPQPHHHPPRLPHFHTHRRSSHQRG